RNLRIKQRKALPREAATKCQQRDFRGVISSTEHRLTKKHAADRDAVNAADQFVAFTHFNRMRMAEPMQLAIRFEHLVGDPRAAIVFARLSTARHDLAKRAISGD